MKLLHEETIIISWLYHKTVIPLYAKKSFYHETDKRLSYYTMKLLKNETIVP